MQQTDLKSQSRELNDLPKSDDEFWGEARIELRDMGLRDKHNHGFGMVNSREIKCSCGMGLFIGVGDSLKEGHLYHEGQFII